MFDFCVKQATPHPAGPVDNTVDTADAADAHGLARAGRGGAGRAPGRGCSLRT